MKKQPQLNHPCQYSCIKYRSLAAISFYVIHWTLHIFGLYYIVIIFKNMEELAL